MKRECRELSFITEDQNDSNPATVPAAVISVRYWRTRFLREYHCFRDGKVSETGISQKTCQCDLGFADCGEQDANQTCWPACTSSAAKSKSQV